MKFYVCYYFIAETLGYGDEYGGILTAYISSKSSWDFNHNGVSECVWIAPIPNPWTKGM